MNKDLIILPRGNHSAVCSVKNGNIIEHTPLSFPGMSRFSINEKWISCITKKGRNISLIKIENKSEFIHHLTISLPSEGKTKFYAKATKIVKDTLYLGGSGGKEIIGMYDLRREQTEWIPLTVPDMVIRRRKSIDDFIVDNDRLIAVDNRVFPKWLLLYDISKPEKPQLKDHYRLEHHGPYEHIKMATIGLNWIAILSSTTGRSGYHDHISLLDKKYLKEDSVLNCNHYRTDRMTSSNIYWGNISFLGDLLLITSSNGIGVLDFNGLKKSRYASRNKKRFFYCFPKTIIGDSILKIIPIKISNEIIVVSQKSDKIFSTLVSKEELLSAERSFHDC